MIVVKTVTQAAWLCLSRLLWAWGWGQSLQAQGLCGEGGNLGTISHGCWVDTINIHWVILWVPYGNCEVKWDHRPGSDLTKNYRSRIMLAMNFVSISARAKCSPYMMRFSVKKNNICRRQSWIVPWLSMNSFLCWVVFFWALGNLADKVRRERMLCSLRVSTAFDAVCVG